jgi:putative SOS response-associated peptidase YedK
MCYDTLSLTERSLTYAQRIGYSDATIAEMQQSIDKLQAQQGPYYHVSGFAHPSLPVVRSLETPQVELMQWGLIPPWVKTREQAEKIWNKTLNARGETLFEKPAFRVSARRHRCLILVDGFYEHHHLSGRTYPFLIRHHQGQPLLLAGVYSTWTDPESKRARHTFSIVTTQANELLQHIHNNPKMNGPRMPVILPPGEEYTWLEASPQEIDPAWQRPFPTAQLTAHPVSRLRGKNAVGNQPQALKPAEYPELQLMLAGLPTA